jgi:hypothetical protein
MMIVYKGFHVADKLVVFNTLDGNMSKHVMSGTERPRSINLMYGYLHHISSVPLRTPFLMSGTWRRTGVAIVMAKHLYGLMQIVEAQNTARFGSRKDGSLI